MTPEEKSLVLVVGAGASSEVGLPVGSELTAKIAHTLDIKYKAFQIISGDSTINDAFKQLANDINPLLRAAWHIRDGMSQAASIDNFIS